MPTIRIALPTHLRTLARVTEECAVELTGPVTQRSVLDALETAYPMLRGTIRDQVTRRRRPFVRFFACEQDLSHEEPDTPLPDAVARGDEPFLVIGAIAGGESGDSLGIGDRGSGIRGIGEEGSAEPVDPVPASTSARAREHEHVGRTGTHAREQRRTSHVAHCTLHVAREHVARKST